MIARGRVQNGVVVLDNAVRLFERQEVTMLAPDAMPASPVKARGRTASWTLRPSVLVRYFIL
jgi:hypothetical protein